MTTDDRPLEERLARDAAQWPAEDTPPPFDLALDRAIATRRPRHTWLAVAAAVVAVAAVVTALVARPWHSSNEPAGGVGTDSAAAGPPPHGLHWATVTNVGFDAVVLDQPTPTKVSVMVSVGGTGECSVAHPRVTSVSYGDDRVTIVVAGQVLLPKPTESSGTVGFSCVSAAGTRALAIQLPGAIGSRSVYDGLADRPRPVIDPAELPAPDYLPAGYTPDGVQPVDAESGRYLGERDYVDGHDRILVMVGTVDQVQTDDQHLLRYVDINGRQARVTGDSGTCVTWTIRASVETAVCAVGGPDAHLPTSEVVKVARSLH